MEGQPQKFGSNEVLEVFEPRLAEATDSLNSVVALETSAIVAETDAIEARIGASTARKEAMERLGEVRMAALSAVESTGDIADDKLAAMMRIKGKSEDEVENYFGHISAVNEEQPVVIVRNSSKSNMPEVVYGNSLPGGIDFIEDGQPGERERESYANSAGKLRIIYKKRTWQEIPVSCE